MSQSTQSFARSLNCSLVPPFLSDPCGLWLASVSSLWQTLPAGLLELSFLKQPKGRRLPGTPGSPADGLSPTARITCPSANSTAWPDPMSPALTFTRHPKIHASQTPGERSPSPRDKVRGGKKNTLPQEKHLMNSDKLRRNFIIV